MSQVVTELVIDASGAEKGAEAYSAAMDKAAAAANDNLKAIADNTAAIRGSIEAMNDNARQAEAGSRSWGVTLAEVTNGLRRTAEAAYALSPAFRGAVNAMAIPALQAAGAAIAAVAGALVTGVNLAGAGLVTLSGFLGRVLPQFPALASAIGAAGAAMAAFNPTLAAVGSTILSTLAPALSLLAKGLLIYDAIKLVEYAWKSASEQIREYAELSRDAASVGVTPAYLQRLGLAFADAGGKISDATATLKKFAEAATPDLGGSAIEKRLAELTEAGNFKGNTGVSEFLNAASTEDRFRAIVSLIDQAMNKGERLAAIDLAKTFASSEAVDALRQNSEYFKRIQESADRIASDRLARQEDVDIAASLTQRYDAAVKILGERWIPFQTILNELGRDFQMIWISLLETIAEVLTKVYSIGSAIGSFLKDMAQSGAFTFNPNAGAANYPQKPSSDTLRDDAMQRLRTGLANNDNIAAAAAQSNAIYSKVFADTSRDPKKVAEESTAAYDRASEALLKYIETTKAAAQTIDGTAAAQERAKAMAQLLAAAEKDGMTVTAGLRKEMEDLATPAGDAADALARARVSSQIRFDSRTAFLSSDDVRIAQQLKSIYGTDVPAALASSEAQAMRFNSAMQELSGTLQNNLANGIVDILSGTKTLSAGFSDMAKSIARDVEQVIIKIAIIAPLMRSLQGIMSGGVDISGLGFNPFGFAPGKADGGLISGPGTGTSDSILARLSNGEFVVNAQATASNRALLEAINRAPGYSGGGYVGGAPANGNAPQVNVTLIESPNGGGNVSQKQNSNGGLDIEIAVSQIAAKSAARPGAPLNQVLVGQLGARQALARR